jgi:hypothetical protein
MLGKKQKNKNIVDNATKDIFLKQKDRNTIL